MRGCMLAARRGGAPDELTGGGRRTWLHPATMNRLEDQEGSWRRSGCGTAEGERVVAEPAFGPSGCRKRAQSPPPSPARLG
jgi:hypothetical protein